MISPSICMVWVRYTAMNSRPWQSHWGERQKLPYNVSDVYLSDRAMRGKHVLRQDGHGKTCTSVVRANKAFRCRAA
jgi:hypothetical protein